MKRRNDYNSLRLVSVSSESLAKNSLGDISIPAVSTNAPMKSLKRVGVMILG